MYLFIYTHSVVVILFLGGAIEMIASTGSVAVHHHDNSVTYSMLGCMLVLAGTFTSVSVSFMYT